MQDVTPWPTSFDVSEPVARVLIDGREVDIESVTVSSELDSSMPDRVAAGGGAVVAATGGASIVRADAVSEAGFNPWGDARSLVEASEVVVEAGYRDPASGEVGCARQLTGQVESLGGGALSNTVNLEFVDHTPLLDRDITLEPLLKHYPPLGDWAPIRAAGLSPIYVTDRVLRHCGFYATPPLIPGAMLSAPLMGSAVPERGTLRWASAHSDGAQPAAFQPVPWGVALDDGLLGYIPDLSDGSGRLTSPIHVSFMRRRSLSTTPVHARIELRWGSDNNIIRVVLGSRETVSVQYMINGSFTVAAIMSGTSVFNSETFTVIVEPSGRATIYSSNGDVASGTSTLPPVASTQDISEIRIHAPLDSPAMGGVQVAKSAVRNHTFQRTAHLDPPASRHSLEAFPSQIKVNCLALLKEQAEAELAAMWIDEFGHFWWRNRHTLRASAPRGTLTSKDNLLDVPWEIPIRSVFSRVEVEHEVPTVTRRGVASITVSDSRGSTLSNEDTEAQFFEPPADQDWHQVDHPQWMGGTFSYWALRRGRGSYHGGVVVDEENNERLAYSSRLLQSWEQLGPQRWLLSSEARGLAEEEYVEQSFRDRPDLYGRFAEENLPIIRAKGLVQWETESTTGTARGPVLAPTYVHPVGPWIQDPAEIRSLANWLAEYLTKPDVVLRSIPIVPDPRLQLGDVFWLEDNSAYGVRLRVIVMGKTMRYQASGGGYEMSQEITCRVIAVERLGVRYDELQAAWEGRDYDDFESAWVGQDYAALEADPLDRS